MLSTVSNIVFHSDATLKHIEPHLLSWPFPGSIPTDIRRLSWRSRHNSVTRLGAQINL